MGIELIIGAAVGFAYLAVRFTIKNGYTKKCKTCGKWFALKQIKTETIGQKQTMKKESYKVDSGEFEVIERNNKTIVRPRKKTLFRNVPATEFSYKNTHECRFCKNTSSTYSKEVI
jgi:hypothetical protein